MPRRAIALARQYQKVLQSHLMQGSKRVAGQAQALGRRAVTIGLGTLDLARIHQRAMETLFAADHPCGASRSAIRRASVFFARSLTPIEQTHRLATETNTQLAQLKQRLHRRSLELTATNVQLKEQIAQRRSAEVALQQSEQHYARLLEQSRQMQDQLRLLSRQLLSAQEEERRKISRELHDVIAQTLTGINVELSGLKNKASTSTKGLERSIARTQRMVVQSVDIVHRFARELRPTVLDDLGLVPALHTFMKNFHAETGIQVSLSAFAGLKQVNSDIRTVMYRIAQEALTNVARHAQAARAEVKIEKADGAICLTIKDNGRGFQEDCVLRTKRGKRLGLLGMRERSEMVGGTFTVSSVPGKGTTVLAKIPLIDGRPRKREGEADPLRSS